MPFVSLSSCLTFFYKLLFIFLGSSICCCEVAAQAASVKSMQMYCCGSLTGFTRFPIDSVTITAYHKWVVNVPHPQAFLRRLHLALAPQSAPVSRKFGHEYVRVLYLITYADGRLERVQQDAARTILWQHQLYSADAKVEKLLLSPLTRKQQLVMASASSKRAYKRIRERRS
jgi:hypothetical protein